MAPPLIRVWAPRATSVMFVRGTDEPGPERAAARGDDGDGGDGEGGTGGRGEWRPMQAEPGGWWSGRWPDVGPGTDYRFSLDGGPPLPDPRSAWQPAGVHGPSRLVDHAAFPWTDVAWRPGALVDAVIYELHVGTFTAEGTFDGAVARLDHLVRLGVSHVELMPVNAFPGVHGWGYDGVALFAPHEPYGGPAGFRRLVNACHARGLAVILDVVYNHLGPDGNYTGAFGPYQTDRYRTPWGMAVNLDGPGSDEVRRFFVDNALGWLRDYHIDGLRIDAVHALVDTSATHFLEQLASEVAALSHDLGRNLVLIAESDLNDPRLVRAPVLGGYGLDATWSDDLHHALHVALTGERSGYYEDFAGLPDVVRAMREIYVYAGRHSAHRERVHGRSAEGLDPGRFVVFSQNHDQIGNRAAGERLGHLAGLEAARIAAAIVLAGPFVPLLFQGEEWAASTPFQYFADHQDAALAQAVSEGRRREFAAFGWTPDQVPDPQDPATLNRSRLNWAEIRSAPHADMLDWYRRLIALRRRIPGLRDGRRPTVRADLDAGWVALDRAGASVLLNLGAMSSTIPWPNGTTDRSWALALGSRAGINVTPTGVEIAPMAVALVTSSGDAAITLTV